MTADLVTNTATANAHLQDMNTKLDSLQAVNTEGFQQVTDAINDLNLSADMSGVRDDLQRGMFSDEDLGDTNISDGSGSFGDFESQVTGSFEQFKMGDILGLSGSVSAVVPSDPTFSTSFGSVTLPIHDFFLMIDPVLMRQILLFVAAVTGMILVLRGS